MLRAAVPGRSEPEYAALADAFRRAYDTDAWRRAIAYPGAATSLARLNAGGVRLFVVTNKRESAARRVLAAVDLDIYFENVVGQSDTAPARPKADLGARCVADARLDLSTLVAVGDSDQDADMARTLGVPFIAFTGGAGPLGSIADDRRWDVDTLQSVPDLLLGAFDGSVS
jgi:phosphoglycolate phosphatase